ncbi:MAG: carboxymuconolactone decarboxylase family protein [Ignavibacteriales bacterium]|nr:carboxymuconolactone decarboxylase family protein [Ignavibacteriales bacterium]
MTTRLKTVDPAKATGKAKEFLDEVNSAFGMTPNLMKTMANSPAVLRAYLDFNTTLSTGSLDAKLRERIALSVSESNQCEYCLSAHSAIGKMVGLGEKDILGARQGKASDPKIQAGLVFAQQLVERQGRVSNDEISRVRQTGYTDGEIAEIVANVALTIFTNYINHVAQTDVDFPKVTPGRY